jgi:hypothetical protein
MAGKSRSARYYQENPEARKKKNEYQKEFNKKPSQRKKRSELVQERRKRGIYGKFDGKDVAHTSSGLKMKSAKANRGSKSDTAGDKRARGGRRKKK